MFSLRSQLLQDWTISPDLPQGGDGFVEAGWEAAEVRSDR